MNLRYEVGTDAFHRVPDQQVVVRERINWARRGEAVSKSGRDHFHVVPFILIRWPLDKINWGPRGSGPNQVQVFVNGQEVEVTWKLSVPSFETASWNASRPG